VAEALVRLTRDVRGDRMRERATSAEMIRESAVAWQAFYHVLNRLRQARYIERVARGEYRLTERGWELFG
jgi:predicted transcriptional regulator